MLAINERLFDTPIKKEARYQTIVSEYRRIYRAMRLERSKQYWTMCSQCATADGKPLVGSEYDQITKSDLILPAQWRGVDINPEMIALNKRAYPKAKWYAGDFYWRMVSAKDFNPGIVNVDTMHMPDRAAPFVADIIDRCSRVPGDLMLVINIVTQYRHCVSSIQYFLESLCLEPRYVESWKHCEWQYDNEKYLYMGRTTMGSIILYK